MGKSESENMWTAEPALKGSKTGHLVASRKT